ncbi:DUF7716 domain-containing protein [Variovorax sp. GB1P17]|uniref:DUF7716 domain-containing protein n=1 Tax=Variovorax sp. GB1P17 TaxID=3443740 RepID=UPI003F47DECF
MPQLLNLREAIDALAACHDDSDLYDRYTWVYASDDGPLRDARFYLSCDADEDEEEEETITDESGEDMPAFAVTHGLRHYLEAATFADVLTVQKQQQPLSVVEDYAVALTHYHEQDAFLDLGGFYSGECASNAPLPGISRELFAEYDLQLVACPAEHVGEAARATAALQQISVAQALALCRQLPLSLGVRVTGRERDRIEARFAALSLPLKRTTHRSLAWLPPESGDGDPGSRRNSGAADERLRQHAALAEFAAHRHGCAVVARHVVGFVARPLGREFGTRLELATTGLGEGFDVVRVDARPAGRCRDDGRVEIVVGVERVPHVRVQIPVAPLGHAVHDRDPLVLGDHAVRRTADPVGNRSADAGHRSPGGKAPAVPGDQAQTQCGPSAVVGVATCLYAGRGDPAVGHIAVVAHLVDALHRDHGHVGSAGAGAGLGRRLRACATDQRHGGKRNAQHQLHGIPSSSSR